MNDRKLKIAIATKETFYDNYFQNKELTWESLKKRLSTPKKIKISISEYEMKNETEKNAIKNIGAFVGGEIKGNIREKENIMKRSFLALDADGVPKDFVEKVRESQINSLIYTTASHNPDNENYRYRTIVPLSSDITKEEFEPIARKIAELIGIEYFDKVSFNPAQATFLPMVFTDSKWECYELNQEIPFIGPEFVLSQYKDYRDRTSWPRFGNINIHEGEGEKKDPRLEDSIEGAFCRTYSVEDILDDHPDIYAKSRKRDRYSYVLGTNADGVSLWGRREGKGENIFVTSHHSSDPNGGVTMNAFELYTVLNYKALDDEVDLEQFSYYQRPSMVASKDKAMQDKGVLKNNLSFNKEEVEENILKEVDSIKFILEEENVRKREKFSNPEYISKVNDILFVDGVDYKDEKLTIKEKFDKEKDEQENISNGEMFMQVSNLLEDGFSLFGDEDEDFEDGEEDSRDEEEDFEDEEEEKDNSFKEEEKKIKEEIKIRDQKRDQSGKIIVETKNDSLDEERILLKRFEQQFGKKSLKKVIKTSKLEYFTFEDISFHANFGIKGDERENLNPIEYYATLEKEQKKDVDTILSIPKGMILQEFDKILGYPVKWQGATEDSPGGLIPEINASNFKNIEEDKNNYTEERQKLPIFRPYPAPLTENWQTFLKTKGAKGEIQNSISNIKLILTKDRNICTGIVGENRLRGLSYDVDPEAIIWKTKNTLDENSTKWSDKYDHSSFLYYLEEVYEITTSQDKNIINALNNIFHSRRFNPFNILLDQTPKWDGIRRVPTLYIDYLGVKDDDQGIARLGASLTVQMMIGRTLSPGIGADIIIGIVGPQGAGKSTFFNKLAHGYHDGSMPKVHDHQKASESLVNRIIKEDAEGVSIEGSSSKEAKRFFELTRDEYRRPYDKQVTSEARCNIFVITTNNLEYLSDITGNRRHFPLTARPNKAKKSVWRDLDEEWPQIMAESLWMYRNPKETLVRGDGFRNRSIIIPEHMKETVAKHVSMYMMKDQLQRDIENFLFEMVPPEYDDYSKIERKKFSTDDFSSRVMKGEYRRESEIDLPLVPRKEICLDQVTEELLRNNKNFNFTDNKLSRRVMQLLENMPELEKEDISSTHVDGRRSVKPYSRQSNVYRVTEAAQETAKKSFAEKYAETVSYSKNVEVLQKNSDKGRVEDDDKKIIAMLGGDFKEEDLSEDEFPF